MLGVVTRELEIYLSLFSCPDRFIFVRNTTKNDRLLLEYQYTATAIAGGAIAVAGCSVVAVDC